MFYVTTLAVSILIPQILISIELSEKEDKNGSNLICYEYSQDNEDHEALNQCPDGSTNFDLKSCPPGFHKISDNNLEYCYQISEPSPWNYPCFRSGGASVITELSVEDINSLLNSLEQQNISRYFWLPAKRQKMFNPVVWYIPGPHWGRQFEYPSTVGAYIYLLRSCLVLDVKQRMITTDYCTMEYPNLCFYLKKLQYPATCPNGYHALRFMSDNGKCYGIEHSDVQRLTFQDFRQEKCAKPMGEGEHRDNDLTRFIYKKIVSLSDLVHEWCWFGTPMNKDESSNMTSMRGSHANTSNVNKPNHTLEAIINKNGRLSYTSSSYTLPCMACEAEMIFATKEIVLTLEYNPEYSNLYLTVYYPSALWKYDEHDKGIQCFSDAKGFVKVIDVDFMPVKRLSVSTEHSWLSTSKNESEVERIVYVINPVTDRSAQYWCEGHTKNFSLVTTNKVVVNPQGDKLHVFALVIKYQRSSDDETQDSPIDPNISTLIANIETALQAEKALLMDILEYTLEEMLVLVHLHVKLCHDQENLVDNIVATYDILKSRAQNELILYNITFVNISSSIYCLPTHSVDYMILHWEMTEIGHTVSPKQFCLQDNGLPVTRHCDGSYNLGSIWSEVAGHCKIGIIPSDTTTFLYKFVKGEYSENYTSRFLTEGLGFVLQDIDIIIPADIYYLAESLKHVLSIAEGSSIDMGDIDNIAWAMDRILALDSEYLRLAQSLNSTNVILDSTDEIIKILAKIDFSYHRNSRRRNNYLSITPQFVVQISYPAFNNVTGIAISGKPYNNTFDKMLVQPLFKNSTLESVLSIDNIVIAAWLPESVLETLRQDVNESVEGKQKMKEDVSIITSVYYNDVVFQQLDDSNNIINSMIIGMSVPGYVSNLEHPIPLVFKETNDSNDYKRRCGYWDFQTKKTGYTPGFWDYQGCYYVESVDNVTICECYHMTHFGQLLDFGGRQPMDRELNEKHGRLLNIITLVGCFLSLVGVVGIWLTAAVFQTWRKKAGTKVLLQLSSAIALPLIFIVIFNLDNHIFIESNGEYYVADDMKTMCIVLGALLHYSILASFIWMLITAILQFIRYVRVLGVCRPSRFMIKFTLIGWGIPLIPIMFVLAFDSDNYLPNVSSTDSVKGPICYPSGYYFVVSVLLPIGIILLINVILFILVIYSISRGPGDKMRSSDMDLVCAQFRLSVFLFFLLGLTWVFGLISFSGNLLWSYLFCLTSTLQGFVLFVYFIICDPSTRKLWASLVKPQLRGYQRDSITSLGISNSG